MVPVARSSSTSNHGQERTNVSPQPPRPEPHVTLNIRSTSGNLTGERFNSQNRAQQVLDRAIKDIPLDPRPARPYTLVLERTAARSPSARSSPSSMSVTVTR
jgi:hypothetical protein